LVPKACACVRVRARHLEIGALDDAEVGWDFFAELKGHNVANNKLFCGAFNDDS